MMTSQFPCTRESRYPGPRFRLEAGSCCNRRASSSGNSPNVRRSAMDSGFEGHLLRRNSYVAWPSVPNPRIRMDFVFSSASVIGPSRAAPPLHSEWDLLLDGALTLEFL